MNCIDYECQPPRQQEEKYRRGASARQAHLQASQAGIAVMATHGTCHSFFSTKNSTIICFLYK
jgi:hypothetical protein